MPELQHADIAGNFLSSYGTAQAQQQAQKANAFNQQRVMKQDQYADEDRAHQDAARKTDMVARAALALDTPEKWAAQAPAVMASIGANGPVPGFDQRGRIIAEAQSVAEQLKTKMDERKFALDERQTNAQVAAYDATAAKARAEARAATLPPGQRTLSNEQIDNEAKVRGEYTGQLKDFTTVRDAFGRVAAAAEDPSAAGDLALIFNYMKMLDPASVVREQEFANAQNAAGVPERVRAYFNGVQNGQRLTDQTRADFLDRAGRLYGTQLDSANKTREVYKGLAGNYGFDGERVAPDLSLGVTSDILRPKAPPTFTGSGVATDLSQGGTVKPPAAFKYDANGNRVKQ